jgi:hypothetical protein
MSRSEEKLKYVDYTKYMDKIQDSSCNQCQTENKDRFNPTNSVVNTIGFNPTNRNYNNEDVDVENKLLFSQVNREKKEIIESEMPRLNNYEAFGSINSNNFAADNNTPSSSSFYDGSNDVMRGIMQEYNRVKDKGEFYTFKSTPRRKNIDLSAYMSPPDKVLGRGFGDVNVYEKIYLGEQTRMNDWRPIKGSAPRINDVPYYLTALPVFKDLGGSDTRYLNMKLRQ